MRIIYEFGIPALLTVLSAVMGYVVWLVQQQRTESKEAMKEQRKTAELAEKQMAAIKAGIMLMLRQELFDYHRKFCVLGEEMEAADFDHIVDVYEAYSTLGGNGTGEKAFEEIKTVHLS